MPQYIENLKDIAFEYEGKDTVDMSPLLAKCIESFEPFFGKEKGREVAVVLHHMKIAFKLQDKIMNGEIHPMLLL